MPLKSTLAYIAGFFDGEGSVTVTSAGYLEVRVANRVLEPLALIQETFGGSIQIKAGGVAQIVLGPKAGRIMLEAILPYLRVKRDVATVGIALNLLPYGTAITDTSHLELRVQIYKLNRRTSPIAQGLAKLIS